ncbi:hypothetical protein K505DRAFT_355121 [Melanomma pulvis-pyrius CBS 109.77]|uniref:Xylanolytic transcriptional activator regulatory domain-containing protein n=1 Tax=Melanomma pulvis-pyrius CBS 109.77 TaxID=1314802 RepID=A0A6A6XWZ5_9PLEO|nr:hypothetical protein K505DRAFT_355121 [Melanomma pulvis-pyrius CBS 109.77]
MPQAHRLFIECLYPGFEKPGKSEARSGSRDSKFDDVFRRLDKLEAHVFSKRATPEGQSTQEQPIQETDKSSPPDTTELSNWLLNPGALRQRYVALIVWASVSRTLKQNNTNSTSLGERYFAHTHKWIPMVSQSKFIDGIRKYEEGGGGVSFPLLVLAMHLVVTPYSEHPLPSSNSDLSKSPWYRACKYHLSQYAALMEPSIELIQAGLLIALFEHTQSIGNRALVTLGICGTLASALDMETLVIQQSVPSRGEMLPENQEMVLTWWSLLLLDAYLNLPPRPISNQSVIQEMPFPININSTAFTIIEPKIITNFTIELEAAQKLALVQNMIRDNRRKALFHIPDDVSHVLQNISSALKCLVEPRQDEVTSPAGLALSMGLVPGPLDPLHIEGHS